MNNRAFTLGHSNRAFSEYLKILKDNDIDVIVDIRTYPRSRFCPQFNRKKLNESLTAEGIEYQFKGNNLGGLDDNENYEETVDELVELARTGKNVCVMCSERDYKQCHRYEMLTPSFEERGIEVIHIGV